MNYSVKIPVNIVEKSFRAALLYPKKQRVNFFHDIRQAFKKEIEIVLENYGIVVNSKDSLGATDFWKNLNFVEKESILKFTGHEKNIPIKIDAKLCSKYGHDDYSLEAVNYLDRELCSLPSLLPFKEVNMFSIGNIAILVENNNYDISIEVDEGLIVSGYTYDISVKKRKSYLCLLGIHIKSEILSEIFQDFLIDCEHPSDELDEIRIKNTFFPVTFICRRCGKVLTCSCFEDYLNIKNGLTVQNINIGIKKSICHLCTGEVPQQEYRCSPTPSAFLKRFMPYQYLFALKKYGENIFFLNIHKELKDVENEVREAFGYPQIGEKWISETLLYKMIQMLFPSLEVIHHYRGNELMGLEIDIWIPSLKVGVEYQGIQHFQVVEHWGGEDGLKKRKENDHKKKILCKTLEYHLIEFRYDEILTEQILQRKLKSFL